MNITFGPCMTPQTGFDREFVESVYNVCSAKRAVPQDFVIVAPFMVQLVFRFRPHRARVISEIMGAFPDYGFEFNPDGVEGEPGEHPRWLARVFPLNRLAGFSLAAMPVTSREVALA